MKKKLLIPACMFFLAAVLAIGGYILNITVFSAAKTNEKFQGLKQEAISLRLDSDPVESAVNARDKTEDAPVIPPSPEPYQRIQTEDFKRLQKKYPDIVAWMQIPGTQVDYPVVQSSQYEPEYYLRRDLDGDYFEGGTLFLDASCTMDSDVQIVYGHNMMNGTMFQFMTNYEEPKAFEEHPIIFFDTEHGEEDYVVFAAFKTSVDIRLDDYFGYVRYHFDDAKDKLQYLYDIENRSLVKTDLPVNETDNLLLLSTCEYDFDNCRLVVVARKVRPEEKDGLSVSAEKNGVPLQSSAYYYKYGGFAPYIPKLFEEVEPSDLSWYDGGGIK